jgi:hypothetical protein
MPALRKPLNFTCKDVAKQRNPHRTDEFSQGSSLGIVAIRLSGTSYAEALAATALTGYIGITKTERFVQTLFDEIDLRTVN